MKAIRVILTILVLLTIVFFGTGLVVKETAYSVSVTVNKPLSKTFTTFNDISLIQNWIPEVMSVDTINYNPGRVGSVFKLQIKNPDSTVIEMQEKVLAFIPNEKVTLFYDAENMLKKDNFTFTTKGETTVISLEASCQSDSFILSCIFPYFKGTFKEMDQSYLDNFKSFIEKDKP